MSTSGHAAADKPNPWLARQPILEKDDKVIGYELLFRETADDSRFNSDFDSATSSTISTLNVIGLDAICDGRLAFINCTHQMLLKDYFLLLPPDKVVVEIQESVPADDIVRAACQRLKHKRYSIALDNFVPHDPRQPLVEYADFLKVDIRRHQPEQNQALAATYRKTCRMIAQKVETRVQMLTASKDGFTLFQGYFFRRPEGCARGISRGFRRTTCGCCRLSLRSHNRFRASRGLTQTRCVLCYRLLRYLNSPLLGLSAPVQSIRHAMSLLGERELVRWIRMATTLEIGNEKCSDLVLSALVRAHFCELDRSQGQAWQIRPVPDGNALHDGFHS